jgi:hypothetical protein
VPLCSSSLAAASAGEERVGRVAKQAGAALERDGRQSKQYWRGEEFKEEAKKPEKEWWRFW